MLRRLLPLGLVVICVTAVVILALPGKERGRTAPLTLHPVAPAPVVTRVALVASPPGKEKPGTPAPAPASRGETPRPAITSSDDAEQAFRLARERDPAAFRRFMDEALDPTSSVAWLLGALANVDALSPAERARFLLRVARGQEERVRALEDRADAATEVMARRQLSQDVRAAFLDRCPGEARALVLDSTTDPDDRLFVAGAFAERGPLEDGLGRALAPLVVAEIRGTAATDAQDERRVTVLASLPPGEVRTGSMVAALGRSELGEAATHQALAAIAGEEPSPRLARTLVEAARGAAGEAARLRLLAAASVVLAKAPEAELIGRTVAALEECVASGRDVDVRRGALGLLSRAGLEGSRAALGRLAAGKGGDLAAEARDCLR